MSEIKELDLDAPVKTVGGWGAEIVCRDYNGNLLVILSHPDVDVKEVHEYLPNGRRVFTSLYAEENFDLVNVPKPQTRWLCVYRFHDVDFGHGVFKSEEAARTFAQEMKQPGRTPFAIKRIEITEGEGL